MIIAFFAVCLVACSGSGTIPASTAAVAAKYLGSLPNNASIYISESSFTVSSGGSTSGTFSMVGGDTSGIRYAFTFAITPVTASVPDVTPNPNPCILTSGGSTTACQLLMSSESAPSGAYTVTVYYYTINGEGAASQQAQASESLPETFAFIVDSNTPVIQPGKLVIMPLSVDTVESYQSTTAIVSLSGSIGINSSNPVVVSIVSNEPSIMSVGRNSCSLYTESNSCEVILTGESLGTATFSASVSAGGYAESTSDNLTIVPYSLSITPLLESTILESNGATYALVSRSGSLIDPLTISVQSTDFLVMNVNPTNVTFNANESSRYVRLTGVTVGSATLSATAISGYTESQVAFTITAAPLFSCVADISNLTHPMLCGCLNQNDGSGLTWYADSSQTGSWRNWCSGSGAALDSVCQTENLRNPGQNGESVNTFNTEAHCEYGDWHLPTAPNTNNVYINLLGGNWGSLGVYAVNNGYTVGQDLNAWLSTNNFSGATSDSYWSSLSFDPTNAWVVMSHGYALNSSYYAGLGILVVRSEQ